MHVYLGLSEVLGGLPTSLKGCPLGKDIDKAAADLRRLLRGRVEEMLARAERAGASVDDMNRCAELHACMCASILRACPTSGLSSEEKGVRAFNLAVWAPGWVQCPECE